ncbi:MAG: DNA translocase FtsK 4TM domain-containing protein [Phycisphaerae bacterium]|nr:DNA translocase FtsK 4TM domain-containing protein [Phycisphaerae bacterium]
MAAAKSEPSYAALRFALTVLLTLTCIFAWCALLSYDVGDPPATSVYPQNSPPHNWCGLAGSHLAHTLYYYLGTGAYALLAGLTALTFGIAQRLRFSDPWFRFLGFAMVCAVCSTLGAIFVNVSDRQTLLGAGGVLGGATADFLTRLMSMWGTLIVLAAAMLIGLLLAADNFVLALAQWLGMMGQRSLPVIRRQGAQVAFAGANAISSLGSAGAAILAGMGERRAGGATTDAKSPTARKPARPSPRLVREEEEAEIAARSKSARKPAAVEEDDEEESEEETPRAKTARGGRASKRVIEEEDEDEELDAEESEDELEDVDADEEDEDAEESEEDEESDGAIEDTGDFEEEEEDAEEEEEEESPAAAATAKRGPIPIQTRFPIQKQIKATNVDPRPQPINYGLPPLTLLEDAPPTDRVVIEAACQDKARVLVQTLREFKLEVDVVGIATGPVITVFELALNPGIKVSQIQSLSNDMARALKAPAVRPTLLPGRNTIGIEVPNIDKEKVRLKEIMQGFGSKADEYAIPLYLGKDASGKPLVNDMTRMPHMLIAGTTGSGKSVCIASIVMSILLTRSPEDVKLILVDPKVVELAMFKDIPHLMCPIVTEMSKAEGILDWAATQMDERYALLAEAGVKDIKSYNKLGMEGLKERLNITDDAEMARIPIKLPYIVIVIDELADLMMMSPKEVEFYLCRIAQKSRAVGIHLIVSTQRPQANVVTGLIKSNLPSRIAFRVASRLDSRIVLDQNGGELLMGQGDMLFLPPGSSKLMRAQGTYIADDELRAIVKHARAQGQPQYHSDLIRMPGAGGAGNAEERDEMFDQAVDIMIESGRGSVSLLQRRLEIGYGRASRLIDQMYAAGIVGEYKGSQAREVLITKDEWNAIRNQRDREESAEEQGANE